MANLQAATTSNSAAVKSPQKVEELTEEYIFGPLTVTIDDSDGLSIHGYGDFLVYTGEEAAEELATEAFLERLAPLLEDGARLDIQTAGYTKCRYPVHAKRYIVEDGDVLRATLDNPTPIGE